MVQEDDNCTTIAEEFGVDVEFYFSVTTKSPAVVISPLASDPDPGPRAGNANPNPCPTDTAPGTKIPYTVSAGDTLSNLAEEFLSDVDRIIEETNK